MRYSREGRKKGEGYRLYVLRPHPAGVQEKESNPDHLLARFVHCKHQRSLTSTKQWVSSAPATNASRARNCRSIKARGVWGGRRRRRGRARLWSSHDHAWKTEVTGRLWGSAWDSRSVVREMGREAYLGESRHLCLQHRLSCYAQSTGSGQCIWLGHYVPLSAGEELAFVLRRGGLSAASKQNSFLCETGLD
ncbi:hypothetical protein RRG08_028326 [Elysia crispata]|uniref:Uncharacterized protein n=1 Tax=Elysia crispata TaxID=231223 RepID=A0AAE1AW34_9GAST|nr:hypothetical protein RRG08_028326 [Elysia crispata]